MKHAEGRKINYGESERGNFNKIIIIADRRVWVRISHIYEREMKEATYTIGNYFSLTAKVGSSCLSLTCEWDVVYCTYTVDDTRDYYENLLHFVHFIAQSFTIKFYFLLILMRCVWLMSCDRNFLLFCSVNLYYYFAF